MRREKLAGHLAVAATYTIFGLNLIFCKDIANAEAVPPVVLFTLRAAGASALFWLISLFLPGERIARGDMGLIALASFTGLFVPQMTFLSAITMATPLDTGILGTLGPIFTMFFAFLFLKEPITFKKAGGVALSFAGVLLLVLNSVHAAGPASTTPMGFALLLLNSLSFALYLGAFRPLIARYSVVTFMKWMFLFSLLMALPFSVRGLLALDFGAIPPKVGWEIGYLIFFATFVAYFLTGQPLHLPPARHRRHHQRLDRHGHPFLAEDPLRLPDRRRRRPGQPQPGGGVVFSTVYLPGPCQL